MRFFYPKETLKSSKKSSLDSFDIGWQHFLQEWDWRRYEQS
jgi:hypothetical protein